MPALARATAAHSAIAVPAPSSVHVSGSSRKAAYIIEWATSATKAAATAARSGTRRAPRNRRASAAASSAR